MTMCLHIPVLILCLVNIVTAIGESSTLWPKSITPALIQEEAVRGLVRRIIPAHSENIQVRVDPSIDRSGGKDLFILESNDTGSLWITGTTGYAASVGLHHYLKHYCGQRVTWFDNPIACPSSLPAVRPSLVRRLSHRFVTYPNVVTFSYSYLWWNWTRWEREIDWMALHGINLPLALAGQEEVWIRVYTQLGLSRQQVLQHFTGPAFLSWLRMGNIAGWGGPLSEDFIMKQSNLQRQILARQRAFGMTPVVPSFAGHVPKALAALYPSAKLSPMPRWNGFSMEFSAYLLDPGDPLFRTVASLFIQTYSTMFNNTDHYYLVDTFNEMSPLNSTEDYLHNTASSTYASMREADPDAVWMMQGWLFTNDRKFWCADRVQAYLGGVPQGRIIVVDLVAELLPQWESTHSFYGHHFIWCVLHNFGGNTGLYGSFELLLHGYRRLVSTLNEFSVGVGMCPEGIEQNEFLYSFASDLFLQEVDGLTNWAKKYSLQRFGKSGSSCMAPWVELLFISVYNSLDSKPYHDRSSLAVRPDRHLLQQAWYDIRVLPQVLSGFLHCHSRGLDGLLFRIDLVDVAREASTRCVDYLYTKIVGRLRWGDPVDQNGVNMFFLVIDLLENLTSFLPHTRLETWRSAASQYADSEADRHAFIFNSLNLVTRWGPYAEINDYANRIWSGLVGGYYRRRWEIFLHEVNSSSVSGKPFSRLRYNWLINDFEKRWAEQGSAVGPSEPQRWNYSLIQTLVRTVDSCMRF